MTQMFSISMLYLLTRTLRDPELPPTAGKCVISNFFPTLISNENI